MEKIVLNSERVLLQTLNFDLNVVHPSAYFKPIINRDLKSESLFPARIAR